MNSKIIISDANDEEFNKTLKKTESNLKSISKEFSKICKLFGSLNAQERYLILDVLIGNLLNTSKLSSSVISSVLFKYLLLASLPSIFQIETKKETLNHSYVG